MFKGAEVIHQYTRAQAIEDGVLVDVTETARQMGFTVPVALTAGVYADCVAWTDQDSDRQVPQDEAGRLHDVLWMAYLAAWRARDVNQVTFELLRVPRGGRARTPRKVRLQLRIGPGDAGEPVITIMMPGES
jgi:hypothetical protein